MKNKIGMGALCVLLVLFVAGVSGCKNDDGDSWVSILSGPKIDAIKDLAFAGGSASVADYEAAKIFVNSFLTWNMGYALAEAIDWAQGQAFDNAFKAKYDGLYEHQWRLLQGKSYSYSVNIDDDTSLKDYVREPENFSTKTVTAGTIKASIKSSTSHSRLTPAEMKAADDAGIDYRQNDDKTTGSSSNSGTMSITGGFVGVDVDDDDETDFKVAGIVQIETSSKGSSTLKDKIKNISTGSGSSKEKVAVALLIDNGTTAAKIRYSSSNGGGWKNRSSGWGGSNDTADVEVWNLAGTTLLFTIPASQLSSREAFRQGFVYGISQ